MLKSNDSCLRGLLLEIREVDVSSGWTAPLVKAPMTTGCWLLYQRDSTNIFYDHKQIQVGNGLKRKDWSRQLKILSLIRKPEQSHCLLNRPYLLLAAYSHHPNRTNIKHFARGIWEMVSALFNVNLKQDQSRKENCRWGLKSIIPTNHGNFARELAEIL